MSAVWVLWTEGGYPLGVFEKPAQAKVGAPIGMQWTYERGRYPKWVGECGGIEAGCYFHKIAIHHTWYIQRFPYKAR